MRATDRILAPIAADERRLGPLARRRHARCPPRRRGGNRWPATTGSGLRANGAYRVTSVEQQPLLAGLGGAAAAAGHAALAWRHRGTLDSTPVPRRRRRSDRRYARGALRPQSRAARPASATGRECAIDRPVPETGCGPAAFSKSRRARNKARRRPGSPLRVLRARASSMACSMSAMPMPRPRWSDSTASGPSIRAA